MANTSSLASAEKISTFMLRHGIGDRNSLKLWFSKDKVRLDGHLVSRDTPVTHEGVLSIRGKDYQIENSQEQGRFSLRSISPEPEKKIKGKIRVQCGYHKCLTVYFKRLSKKTAICHNPFNNGFRHFFHRADEFYADCSQYSISSISGNAIDLDRFDDIRAVHIIRDPRDLIISGYFYHKRAAEPWCDYLNPTNQDWEVVNAPVPNALPTNTSFTDYLNNVSVEEGLLAEIEFRKQHLENMLKWPKDDERVMTVKYEEILGNEVDTVARIYDFYDFPPHTKLAARYFANRYSLNSRKRKTTHIRNANHGQWKDLFTEEVSRKFMNSFGDLLEKYGYPT